MEDEERTMTSGKERLRSYKRMTSTTFERRCIKPEHTGENEGFLFHIPSSKTYDWKTGLEISKNGVEIGVSQLALIQSHTWFWI